MLLEYEFFRNALVAVVIISVASAIVGAYIVTRRLVALAGGVTHACFGGLGLGYFLGISPMGCAAAVAVASALGVGVMERRSRVRSDSAVAVIWALGMAAGVIFIFLTPGYVPELNAFLFGNILTVSRADLVIFGVYTVVTATYYIVRYRVITACAFDPDFARVSRLPVGRVNTVMTILVAIGIVLTIKLVGVMLLMSMMSLPPMIAETFTRRMKPLVLMSVAVNAVCSTGALLLGTVVNVPASALIVVTLAAVWLISRGVKSAAAGRRAIMTRAGR